MRELTQDDIPEIALDWVRSGTPTALATVIQTWGSAPRPVGSMLAITDQAQMMGSVSGGCVEGAVVAEALDALEDGKPRLLKYGVSDDEAFAVGLACGGTIRVLVDPIGRGLSEALLADLVAARAERRPVCLAVNTSTWERRLVGVDGDPLSPAARDRMTADRSGFEDDWFLGVHNPPLKMIVVGAVHIAQALVPMARIAGYETIVVDPREAFGSHDRFPGVRLLNDWPDAALEGLGLDARTAVVTLTHDPKLDDPAILATLASDAFYLGCLGSSRTHAKRVDRLTEAGMGADQIARIHAPVGADIGARSPAEIAVSILAQITERLRRPETRPLATAEAAE